MENLLNSHSLCKMSCYLNVLQACAVSIVVISFLKGWKSRSAFVSLLYQQLFDNFDLWGFANGAQYLLP